MCHLTSNSGSVNASSPHDWAHALDQKIEDWRAFAVKHN